MSRDADEEEAPAGAGDVGDVGEDAGSGESAGAGGTCELCGGPTVERHCKIVCLNCGYERDCSDP